MEQQKLTASDAADRADDFGRSLAISADGQTVVVGATDVFVEGHGSIGSVYVYQWNASSSSFVEQQKLTASDGAEGDHFGFPWQCRADGRTVVVGAPYDDVETDSAGSAYVYQWNASSSQFRAATEAHRQSTRRAGDLFGFGISVAISADMTDPGGCRPLRP